MIKLPPVSIRLRGETRLPDDLLLAAHKTLGEHFDSFIARYGVHFTASDLCSFAEELRNGSRP
jgi:hypothetical protein